MKSLKFPVVELEGDTREIGFKHGSILKDKIHLTVNWYKGIINRDENDIIRLSSHFKSVIKAFNPEYCEEIENIALGADIDSSWIYMLNSRSEIMNTLRNECTAAFFKKYSLLGQNWDWAETLENLGVILKIKRENKPEILMMSEPGIIGKIGMNASGLGVCLNFLDSGKICKGVPIHIILRKILDSASLEEARQNIKNVLTGKSANILIGDKFGRIVNIEFADDEMFTTDHLEDAFLHTNHYLGNDNLNKDRKKLASSFARYIRASELISEFNSFSIANLKQLLLDQSNQDLPICRPYVADPDLGNVGTICTILMDLQKSQLHITRGTPLQTPFTTINFPNE